MWAVLKNCCVLLKPCGFCGIVGFQWTSGGQSTRTCLKTVVHEAQSGAVMGAHSGPALRIEVTPVFSSHSCTWHR